MTNRLPVAALAAALALAPVMPAQAQYDVKAHYVKREVYIPMRDGVKLFTIIYSPRDASRTLSVPDDPHRLRHSAVRADDYRAVLGPNNAFTNEGYIFVYQDTRGKFRSEGEFVHHAPYVKGSPRAEREHRHLRHHRLAGEERRRTTTGASDSAGFRWAGWQVVAWGMIDAHPALQGVVAAGAAAGSVLRRRLPLRRRVPADVRLQLDVDQRARARRRRPIAPAQRFDYGTPDGYRFFLELGAAANARSIFRDEVPTWNDYMTHGTYDEVLAVAQRAEGSRSTSAPRC